MIALRTESPWAPVLDGILQLPQVQSGPPVPLARAEVRALRHQIKVSDGILDFVDDGALDERLQVELEAQGHAVEDYYENEEKLSCQWDRITADELPPRLDYPNGRVLDLGCGTGTAGAHVRRSGARVIGVDLSIACLSAANKRLDAVVRCDALDLPFADGWFDAVVSRGALHHFPDPRGTELAELVRVLRPGASATSSPPARLATPVRGMDTRLETRISRANIDPPSFATNA